MPDEKKSKLLYLKKICIESNINNINIVCDESNKLSNNKRINLEICSNISYINIIQNYFKKQNIFIIQNEYFQLTKSNNNKRYKIEKSILENYINTINIGFDNRKNYDNYNIINYEKDEDSDSDNENDKLETEPVPSFILCIQKMNNNNINEN